ncbi:MAG: SAM-dependent methyltransferase [Geobacteraceae bacterium GWC2_58_44]|nr:MAG: SAM-dependent methyltransferase [Geobacteraceae bacterium GWC2_58_44]
MSFSLEKVVPWGRTFDEYVAMFSLESDDLSQRILGCGDGPACFNATLTSRGGAVISIDPLYQFTEQEIAGRIDETHELVMEQTRQNADEFVWSHFRSIEELGHVRMGAMHGFLADYPQGKSAGRYISGELPKLPCRNDEFDLALCSHFLFLYSSHYDCEFHLQSLRELCRVAREVRVFPVMELGSVRSRHIAAVVSELSAEGYKASIEHVSYEFQKDGNEMLRLMRPVGEP